MGRTHFTGPVAVQDETGKFVDLTANPKQGAIADIADNTGGVADGTLVDVGAAFDQATLNNNFAELAAKVNAILSALRSANIIG